MADESLAERIKRLQQQTKTVTHDRRIDAKYSRTERAREDIRSFGRFVYQVSQGLSVLNTWLLQPLLKFLILKTQWIGRKYKWLWSIVVYRRTEDGVLLFSKTRAAGMIAATFTFVWFMLLPVVECGYEAVLYTLTARIDEKVYLLGSQEINSTMGTHIIEGCSELPCSDQDAIYYRTENSLFNNLWSLWHGRGFFFAEYVGAAVPNQTSLCVTTSYGFRFRLTSRFLNIYPHMLALTCGTSIDLHLRKGEHD